MIWNNILHVQTSTIHVSTQTHKHTSCERKADKQSRQDHIMLSHPNPPQLFQNCEPKKKRRRESQSVCYPLSVSTHHRARVGEGEVKDVDHNRLDQRIERKRCTEEEGRGRDKKSGHANIVVQTGDIIHYAGCNTWALKLFLQNNICWPYPANQRNHTETERCLTVQTWNDTQVHVSQTSHPALRSLN